MAGTSQFVFNSYAPFGWEYAVGTTSAPITTGGPTVKLSRTENIAATVPTGGVTDNECNSCLAVYSVATASDQMQNCAVFAGATSSQTNTASNSALGISAIGRITGSGVGGGTGAYIEGRTDSSSGYMTSQETRASNFSGISFNYSATGLSAGAHWITCNAGGSGHLCGAAVSLGSIHPFSDQWDVGYGATEGSVKNQTFRDDTGSVTSIEINGTHTLGIDFRGASFNAGGGAIAASLFTPSSSSAAGFQGLIAWDANYIYICTAANTWKRAALGSF